MSWPIFTSFAVTEIFVHQSTPRTSAASPIAVTYSTLSPSRLLSLLTVGQNTTADSDIRNARRHHARAHPGQPYRYEIYNVHYTSLVSSPKSLSGHSCGLPRVAPRECLSPLPCSSRSRLRYMERTSSRTRAPRTTLCTSPVSRGATCDIHYTSSMSSPTLFSIPVVSYA